MKKLYTFTSLILLGLFVQAQTNNSLHFDGVDDFVQTTYPGVSGNADRTFEAWINISNIPSGNLAILDYGANATGSRNTLFVNPNGGISYISGGTNANLSSSTNVVPLNQWVHIAFVLSNGTGFIYVDGTQVGTGNLSSVNTPSNGRDLIIGNRVPGGNIRFEGLIDEVRIWDVALTPNDLVNGNSSEICSSSAGLQAYYQFNEGSPSSSNNGIITLPDLISGNDGTLNGFGLNGTISNWVLGAGLTTLINTDLSESNGIITAQQAGATYAWVNCADGSTITGANGVSFAPTAIGNYAAEITFNGCTQLSDCINVSILSNSSIELNNLSLDKNPSQFLSFTGDLDNDAQISIYTLSGQELLKTTMNSQYIDPAVKTGLYIVNVSQNGAVKSFKWIKK